MIWQAIFIIVYLMVGIILGIYWRKSFKTHKITHGDNTEQAECWCNAVWGDLFTLGISFSIIAWPSVIIFLIINKLKKTISNNKSKNAISIDDAGAAFIYRALDHLVGACDAHRSICPINGNDYSALLKFCKEMLKTHAGTKALLRMGHLENQIIITNSKYSELAKLLEVIYNLLQIHDNSDRTCTYKFKEALKGIEIALRNDIK